VPLASPGSTYLPAVLKILNVACPTHSLSNFYVFCPNTRPLAHFKSPHSIAFQAFLRAVGPPTVTTLSVFLGLAWALLSSIPCISLLLDCEPQGRDSVFSAMQPLFLTQRITGLLFLSVSCHWGSPGHQPWPKRPS
jgi:hypothetical protein